MMRFVSAGLAVVIASTAPALAADIYRRSPPPSPTSYSPYTAPFSWVGFYAGLNAGYAWGEISNTTLEPSGFVGGLTLGANWQAGSIVFGPEADIMFSGVDEEVGTTTWDLGWLGTARGRVGFAWDRFLPYFTAGLAFGKGTLTTPTWSDDNTHIGWTIGAGVEGMITQNISAKLEYLYVDLGEKSYNGLVVKNGFDGNLLRAGVNYRF